MSGGTEFKDAVPTYRKLTFQHEPPPYQIPEQHAELQQALAEKGFLDSDQIGPGTHDGEFGPITRNANQQSLGCV